MDDGIDFEIGDIRHIREEDEYENFRVHLIANFGKIRDNMKIDITTMEKELIMEMKKFDYSFLDIGLLPTMDPIYGEYIKHRR